MKKHVLCFAFLVIAVCALGVSAHARTVEIVRYDLSIVSANIPLFMDLDRESEDLAINAERIAKVEYDHDKTLEERNQYILDLLDALETIEIPTLEGIRPSGIYYYAESGVFNISCSVGEDELIEYSVYLPSADKEYLLGRGGYLTNGPTLLGEKVYLYSSRERVWTTSDFERLYSWTGFLKVNGFFMSCTYTSRVNDSTCLDAEGVKQLLSESPVATISEYYQQLEREENAARNAVDVKFIAILTVAIVEAEAIVAFAVLLIRRLRSNNEGRTP